MCADGGRRGQGHLHTSITRVQRARGMKLLPAQSPEDSRGTAGAQRGCRLRAGLLGGELLVLRPRVLPAPRTDGEPKGMQRKSQYPVPPMRRGHGWLRFLDGSCVWPYTTCFCPAQGRDKLRAMPPPKVCYLNFPKFSLYRSGAVREGKWAQRSEVTCPRPHSL